MSKIAKALRLLQRFATENVGWKLLALGVAVVLWATVASEPELSTLATVPLEYRNLPDDLEIASEPVSQVVLELRGPAGELRGFEGALHPAVVFDMSGMRPGVHTFPILDRDVKLPRGVRLVRANPSEARFEFDNRLTRTVPVRAVIEGQDLNGYMLESEKVDPPALQIVGPATRVSRINGVVTDPVDVSAVVGRSEFRVNAFVEDPYVRFVSSPQVVVTVTMKKK